MTTPAVVPEPPVVPLRQKLGQLAAAVVIAAVLAWAWRGAELRPFELFTERGNMLAYLSGFLRPDFLDWRTYLAEMVVTLQIALWGTLLALVAAVPCSLLASSNLVPWWVRQPLRRQLSA